MTEEEWDTLLKVSKFIGRDILSYLVIRCQNAKAMHVNFILLWICFVGHFDAQTKVSKANESLKKKIEEK